MNDMYFDIKMNRVINLNSDVCKLNDWIDGTVYSCFRDEHGFLVFVQRSKIEVSDEYSEGDPYTVSKNLDSNFQQRRFKCTLHLLAKVLSVDCDKKILDLGCGEGHLTNNIKKNYPNAEIHGLDYSMSAIRYAHNNYPDINFIVADGYYPPFVDAYFDVVVLNNIWEHVPDPLYLLKNVSRILKQDGFIIISTPSRYRFSNLYRVLRGKPIIFMSKLHVTEYSIGQVKEQLNFMKFQVVEIYSLPIKERRFFVNMAKWIVGQWLRLCKSQHILESTVFYLARRK